MRTSSFRSLLLAAVLPMSLAACGPETDLDSGAEVLPQGKLPWDVAPQGELPWDVAPQLVIRDQQLVIRDAQQQVIIRDVDPQVVIRDGVAQLVIRDAQQQVIIRDVDPQLVIRDRDEK